MVTDNYLYICTAHDDIRDFANKIIELVNITKDMGINMEAALKTKNDDIQKLNEQIFSLKLEIKDLKRKIYRLKKKEEKRKLKEKNEIK